MKMKVRNKGIAWLLALVTIVSLVGQLPTITTQAMEGVSVSYRSHVQTFGWEQTWLSDGAISGTSGQAKRLEGICINVSGDTLGIRYTTHCQTYGWLPWVSNGEMSGTEGESKRLEAIKIELTGASASNYDVYYRVHAQTYGWLAWAKNGEAAGTAGFAKRLEAIQIRIVPKGTDMSNEWGNVISVCERAYYAADGALDVDVAGNNMTNVMYRTHVQTFGWQGWKNNGAVSGTSGEAKRLEGIYLKLTNQQYSGGICYQTHVQRDGWQTWKSNGEMAGTSGEAKRLEAIRIYLTGDMATHYDVYYRVHAQSYGWLDWVSNGNPAGTSGYAKRLEAIQVVLVEKGLGRPGNIGNIVSNTGTGYVSKTETSQPSGGNTTVNSDTISDHDVTKYTYEIIPLMEPFNDYFFVKTDNPDPSYVRFADISSKYASNGNTAYLLPVSYRFVDVQYENQETGRVNGGYIFEAYEYSPDGGQFVLQQADRAYVVIHSGNITSYNTPNYTNTAVMVGCESVMTSDDYLIKNYTDASKSFFENLDSVESALHSLAVYPKNIEDTSKPSTAYPYPFFATSPYAELSLNEHYQMYQSSDEEFFAEFLHPYVLSSLGFPNMMARVAKKLDPNCTIARSDYHWNVDVTLNGETHSYGGAGTGTTDPIYSKYIQTLFLFDGSADDYAVNATLDNLKAEILEYGRQTTAELETYKNMLHGENISNAVGNGSWLRVVTEGSGSKTYTYVSAYRGTGYGVSYVEDVWVDGRYVNKWNRIDLEASYSDYPEADILVRNMTFTNSKGQVVTHDVLYEYNSSDDSWYATQSYYERNWWTPGNVAALPDNMKLTREQVNNMQVDRNVTQLPGSGLIYDGSVYPGTPFSN